LPLCFWFFAGFLWVLLVPQEAEDIGHPLDDPQSLLGCYLAGDTQIRLEEDWAEFDGVKVPISFGMRKALREVLYPERFPWFDPAKGAFRFKSDRFELIDIEQDDSGVWFLQIWNSTYLDSGRPEDLSCTRFVRADCK
jgi:hypothetical protein